MLAILSSDFIVWIFEKESLRMRPRTLEIMPILKVQNKLNTTELQTRIIQTKVWNKCGVINFIWSVLHEVCHMNAYFAAKCLGGRRSRLAYSNQKQLLHWIFATVSFPLLHSTIKRRKPSCPTGNDEHIWSNNACTTSLSVQFTSQSNDDLFLILISKSVTLKRKHLYVHLYAAVGNNVLSRNKNFHILFMYF